MAGLVAMARRVAVCLRGTAELLSCWAAGLAVERRVRGVLSRRGLRGLLDGPARDMAEGMIDSRSASAERLSRLLVCVVSCCLWLAVCWSCEGHLNFPHGINTSIYLSIYL